MKESQAPETALRKLLGQGSNCLSIPAFLAKHVAQLPPMPLDLNDPVDLLLSKTMIAVPPLTNFPALKISSTSKKGGRSTSLVQESLSSLVDNVVWSLVQRREQLRRLKKDGRNLLCQGFVVASEDLARSGAQSVRSMPSGIVLMQMNNNVDYCKTQPLFQRWHRAVGDTVLRALLMHCQIFVPIESDMDRSKGNYLQVAGPPLRFSGKLERPKGGTTNATNDSEIHGRRRKRKRRRGPTSDVPPKLAPSATILKKPLLDSDFYMPRVGLPKHHILNQLSAGNPKELLGNILDLRGCTGKINKKRWKRLRGKGLDVCAHILRNHCKCDYTRVLERYCPIPNQLDKRTRDDIDLALLSASFTPHEVVASFLKGAVKRVFPEEMWGCPKNLDCVMEILQKFVHARRQEHLPNKELLKGILIKKFDWLRADSTGTKFARSDHDTTQRLVLLLFRWVLEKFAIPLLNSTFHVTESEFTGKQLVYYRKPVWTMFRSMSMKKLLKTQYKEITQSDAAARLENQKMGFSQLRLLPKETGVRPIATLSKSARVVFDVQVSGSATILDDDDRNDEGPVSKRRRTQGIPGGRKKIVTRWAPSTNSILSNAFAVLRFEYDQDRTLFGSGMDGLHQFYPRYRSFIMNMKPRSAGSTQLVFGSVDIRHCFDSINQEELMKTVRSILSESDYCIQSYMQYRPYESMARLLKLKRNLVGPPEAIDPFHQVAQRLAESSHNTVYADTVSCAVAKNSQVLEQIDEHLKSHLVVTPGRRGNRYLLQSRGVPQGSTLSTLLCNLYYGRIESRLLKSVEQASPTDGSASHLVVRQVDDFLFVGTQKQVMHDFLVAMLEGDQELGVQVNEEKTRVSTRVDIVRDDSDSETLKPSSSGRYFPWCGMLFNVATGEVGIDYSRFWDGKAGHAIAIDRSRSEGEELVLQLKSFVRPRCIPILYDRYINSVSVQQANLYQMMVFAATKLIIYLRARELSIESMDNICYIVNCIEATISFSGALIRSRLRVLDASWDINLSLRNHICWKAFHDVSRRVASVRTLLPALHHEVTKFGTNESLDKLTSRSLRFMKLRKLLPPDEWTPS